MNIWHDISPDRIKEEDFITVIEVPKGSRKKYEIDKETGLIKLDRILQTSVQYPSNYGFIPRTLSEDGDALDVLVMCSESITPHTLVRCRPLGYIEMIDNGVRDEKVIAVIRKDPYYLDYDDIFQLPAFMVKEVEHFLSVYKALDKRAATEVRPIQGKAEAMRVIRRSLERYNKEFGLKQ